MNWFEMHWQNFLLWCINLSDSRVPCENFSLACAFLYYGLLKLLNDGPLSIGFGKSACFMQVGYQLCGWTWQKVTFLLKIIFFQFLFRCLSFCNANFAVSYEQGEFMCSPNFGSNMIVSREAERDVENVFRWWHFVKNVLVRDI